MTDTPCRPNLVRRIAIAMLAGVVLLSLALIAAGPADAAPACCPVPRTWYSTITVAAPALGTVIGTDASGGTVVGCAASGGTCVITDSQDGFVRPTFDWPTYTFSYQGPSGYAAAWGGRCSGRSDQATCTITNDQNQSSLTATSQDVQAPSVSITSPARVGPSTTIRADATDNSGTITGYAWSLCNSGGTGCLPYQSGPTRSSIQIAAKPSGNYVVQVRVLDPSSNEAFATAPVTFVNAVSMTWTVLPALTEEPSFTFHSDDETHVPVDAAHRRCRAYPTGTTPGGWGTCTTSTSYAPPSLADGAWTLQADEIDDLGLEGTVTQNTVIDNTAPAVAFIDGPGEGAAVTTPSAQFSFTATDANPASVTCKFDDAAATACTSPRQLSGYRNGTHTFTVTATDELVHTTSVVRHFSVDLPLRVALTVAKRVTPTTPLTATASDDGATITDYAWSLCSAPDDCVPLDSGPSRDSIELSGVRAGSYTVRVVVSDDQGRNSAKAAGTVLVTAVHVKASKLARYTSRPSVTFRSDDVDHVASSRCRAHPTAGDATDVPWVDCTGTFAPRLADGAWTLEEAVIDDLGLRDTATQQTIVDTTAPNLSFTAGPVPGGAVQTTSVPFGFTAHDANPDIVTCKLDGAAPTACASPHTVAGYGNGRHTFTVKATDMAGNTTSVVRPFSVAVATSVHPKAARVTVSHGHPATLSARISPASATGHVRFAAANGKALCTATVRSGAATCKTSPTLGAGRRAVTATYTGNYSRSGAHLILTVTKAPTALRASAPDQVRHGRTLTVTATHLPAKATGTVTVERGGRRLCSARVRNGSARCAFAASMPRGSYHLSVRYGGNANYAASSRTIHLNVTR